MKSLNSLSKIAVFSLLFCFLPPVAGHSQQGMMQIASAVICENVISLAAVNEGNRFPASVGKLCCLNKVANIAENTEIVHIWYHGDTERARVRLKLNPPAWRTYSSKRIQPHEVGAWRVDITDSAGNLLTSVQFDISP